ncbi:MAG: VapC toxin family PIN domain ribonuclease [Gallionellaceae bacterium CG1_02_60_948]|nr:MAG: VapC toxin family PIN domain ribonuclease [Gallionellaceae bacterium CG1_02_60_948]PIU17341.1 MAG: VapC toxin family PIN domain ribonuclease [Gallionellales bacterium CG08_land_8_20_14_0_20_59_87]
MIGLDTNVLVRYLAQDDKAQSTVATKLIEQTLSVSNPGFISVVSLVEVVWVLEGCYGSTRDEVVDIVERLLRVKQLQVQDAEVVWQAVRVFRNGKADFADCLIEREGSAHGCDHTISFDKTAVKAAGMVQLA